MSSPAASRDPPARSAPAPDESAAAAARIGLRWISDAEPGLRRERHGGAFGYRDAQGREIADATALDRIRRLAIPPAWEDVWICTRADGHLQATGRDARGRKQYRYHPEWQLGRGATKFDSLLAFGAALPRIRRRVERVLSQPGRVPTRERVLAALVRLLDTTWLRIGNVEYARENRSYGLSTLQRNHAGVRGDEIRLSFVGKSGVRHDVRLTDRRIAGVVRRCRELPGQELFQYLDADGTPHRVDSSDVNDWLAEAAGCRVTAKDFRTWHGSVLALDLTLAACAAGTSPCTPREILQAVSRRLGNTVAVCRKAYIHPRVLALGDSLVDDAAKAALLDRHRDDETPPRRGLRSAERRLMTLLSRRERARRAAADGDDPARDRARSTRPRTARAPVAKSRSVKKAVPSAAAAAGAPTRRAAPARRPQSPA